LLNPIMSWGTSLKCFSHNIIISFDPAELLQLIQHRVIPNKQNHRNKEL